MNRGTDNESRKVCRWGILGTARIADKVGAAIQAVEGSELVAVASRDSEKARHWAQEHGLRRSFGSYRELIDCQEIDAVYIPLPTSMHREWTIAAAEAGKHVLCEKPLAMDAAEASEMIAACAENRVQLMDGTFWVHHARTGQMLEVLQAGTLGEIRRITSAFTFCWPEPPLDNIRLKPDLGGGCLGDLGWYCVRAALWVFGDLPERVYADARFVNGVDYSVSALMWHGGSRVASFDCGFDTVMRQWMEIAGTANSLVCDDFVLARSENAARFWIHNDEGISRQVDSPPCVQQREMIRTFAKIATSGALEPRWPAESQNTMKTLDALAKSARTRSVVEVAR